jgi:hypothetical protein
VHVTYGERVIRSGDGGVTTKITGAGMGRAYGTQSTQRLPDAGTVFPEYVMAHATITREVVEHPQRRVDFLLQSVFKSIHFAVSYQKNAVLYWQQTILLGIFST